MKKLWTVFAIVVLVSFGILGWIGTRIYQEMPPIPDRVVTADGTVIIASGEIGRGQNVWQIAGRHGSRLDLGAWQLRGPGLDGGLAAPRGISVLDDWAQTERQTSYDQLPVEEQAQLRGRLEQLYRTNTYDPATGAITIDPVRARAFESAWRTTRTYS